jgi:protein-ribulosamine 3-kinase
MNLLPAIAAFIATQGWGEVVRVTPVGGGCINQAARLETRAGPPALVKFNREGPADMFLREAEGLRVLGQAPGAPHVPRVLGVGTRWILLEYILSAPRQPGFDAALAGQLAALHNVTASTFGFDCDNYIGSTPQSNRQMRDGHQFFAEQRLQPQARMALEQGLIGSRDAQSIEAICRRLPDLVPPQPASLVHGDLWGGNMMTGPLGEPVLIDPAAHYGWAETELGMMQLFGGFDARVFEAYAARRALAPGWRDRLDLYNIYHLLNHVNLFGAGYVEQLRRALSRYS